MSPPELDLEHEPDRAGGRRIQTLLASVQDLASSLHRLTSQLQRELEGPATPGPARVAGVAAGSAAGWAAERAELDRLRAELEQLRAAQEARVVIEQAKGMLMADRGCTDRQAFDLLVRMSQAEQRKVRDIAAELVAAATNDRSPQIGLQAGPPPAAQSSSTGSRPGPDRRPAPVPDEHDDHPGRRIPPATMPGAARPGLRIDLDEAERTVPVARQPRPR